MGLTPILYLQLVVIKDSESAFDPLSFAKISNNQDFTDGRMEKQESGIRNPESGNGTETGSGSRLTKIEDIWMVLLTIITCSKN